jgi:GT2 family glycosyltransferase
MLKINLFDNNFRHLPVSTHGKLSKHIEYVRDLFDWHGITVFTDMLAYSGIVDKVKSKYKIAWFFEPRVINPYIYDNFRAVKDKFDFAMTYDEELLNQFPKRTKFVPHGGCWIRKDNFKIHNKTKKISMIYSDKTFSGGHRLRHEVASRIRGIDLFGSGSLTPIQSKEEGLTDYMFSIAIENSNQKNYFTEKILDCFAVGTIPIYWGCSNIHEFFDSKGIIPFSSVEELEKIVAEINEEVYHKNIQAIQRNLELSKTYEVTEDWIYENIFKKMIETKPKVRKAISDTNTNITGLIFSKDRAMQLDASLRSFLLHCKDADEIDLKVLYTVSSTHHEDQYKKLKEEYTDVDFIREENFRNDLLSLLTSYNYVLFLVDDNIFVNDFSLYTTVNALEQNPKALGFSLRLGKNTSYCYMQNKQQVLPNFYSIGNSLLAYDWTAAEYDFGYPLEVSSSVYRIEDMLPFISQLPFNNPNTLEALLDKNNSFFQKTKPLLLCPEQSVTFCAPVNIVQTAWTNRASGTSDYTADNLSKLFDKGIRINIAAYDNFTPKACHQEIELHFLDHQGKHYMPSGASQPLVSIAILNFNGWNHIQACLESIKKYTPEKHEIIIVDNGSTDGSKEFLRSIPEIILVENPTNIGVTARAQLLSLANGDYVVFLDNDTIVTRGWLAKFLGYAKADSSIGMIGACSNYASGLQGIVGTSYRNIDEMEKFADAFAEQHRGHVVPSPRLVSFCEFITRDVMNKIGCTDTSFGKFGFEDDDYSIRAAIAGFKVVVAYDIFIHHTGGPQGRGDPQYNKWVCDAWEIFREKWGIPKGTPYGQYDIPIIISEPFDRKKHFIPIPDHTEVAKLLYKRKPDEQKQAKNKKTEGDIRETPVEKHARELVSIVVLIYNNPDFIKQCIKSIRYHTPEAHEIIFVPVDPANAPMKQIRKYLKENENYHLADGNPPSPASEQGSKSPGRLSYPQACNIGINASHGEYIVLLSDDVVVTEGWLGSLIECIGSGPDTGIVGPMTVHVDGPQGVVHPGYDSLKNLNSYAVAFRKTSRYRRLETTTLYDICLIFRKQLSDRIGLMDEQLEIPDFADNDYCLRAASEGFRNMIAGDVFVHCQRDRTLAGRQGDFAKALTKISKLFSNKWSNLDINSTGGKRIFSLNILSQCAAMQQKGERGNAIAVLLDSIKHVPGEKVLSFKLAELLIEDRRFSEANDVLQRMPGEPNQDSERLALMGYCKKGLDIRDEAEEYADQALALNNSSPKALTLKGIIASEKGLVDAEQFFTER